eukprot:g18543.t1
MTGSLSVITNERGGVIDDTLVTKCSSKEHGEHVYQVVNAGCAPKDLKHFEEQLGKFGGDVKMEVMWDNRGLFAIQGPKAAEVLQRLSPSTDLKSVPFGQCFWMTLEGAECLVSRCGYTGEDGFEVFVPGSAAVPVWQLLTSQAEVRLAGLGARDSLRLEAGLCLYGHELDEDKRAMMQYESIYDAIDENQDTSPCEAGLSWVIPKARRDGAKNKFIGSDEILAQLSDKSRYKRLRAGLMPASGPPAREGAEIETLDEQVVGKVTSGSMSPCLKKNISIGLRLERCTSYFDHKQYRGTDLQVVVRGKRHPAKVVKMPFAARALAFSSEDQVASVASCLKDESWLVRREACASLGVLSSVKGRSALEKALRSDSDSRVREEAAKSLAAISKSAKLLGKSTDATGFPTDALAAALKDEEVRVRTAAIVALGSQPVAARQHAGYLVEQLLTGDRDVRAAVFTVFQEATSHAGARLVAAAFDAGKRHQDCETERHRNISKAILVRQEAEEIMAWSRAIARHVLRLAQDLRAASREAQLTAERHLSLLGPAAGVCLVNEVVKTKGADFGQRMATIRGLISCFSASERARLPPDLACAALSEWIYEPSLEHLPVPGLELVKLQTPEEHHGINLQSLGRCRDRK